MSCVRTYCGLCIYSATLAPEKISQRLGIEPTRTAALDPESKYKHCREQHFWLLSTQDQLDSTDHIDHLHEIFGQLEGKATVLNSLRNEGCTTRVSCYWDSDGQGGPWLDLPEIKKLAEFGLDIWWDIYFVQGDETNDA